MRDEVQHGKQKSDLFTLMDNYWPLIVGVSYALIILFLFLPMYYLVHRPYSGYGGYSLYGDEIQFMILFAFTVSTLSFYVMVKKIVCPDNSPLISKYLIISGFVHTVVGGFLFITNLIDVLRIRTGYYQLTYVNLYSIPFEQMRFDIIDPFAEWGYFYLVSLLIFTGVALSLLGIFIERKQTNSKTITIFGTIIPLFIPVHIVIYIDNAIVGSNLGVLYAIIVIPALCIISGYISFIAGRKTNN